VPHFTQTQVFTIPADGDTNTMSNVKCVEPALATVRLRSQGASRDCSERVASTESRWRWRAIDLRELETP
jgi:hypothetical protein